MLEARNHAEQPLLLSVLEVVLEAHDVVGSGPRVLLAKLHDGVGGFPCLGIPQADRLHRTESERVGAPSGKLLNRQAALEVVGVVELVGLVLPGREQGRHEPVVLFSVHRTVDVVVAAVQ